MRTDDTLRKLAIALRNEMPPGRGDDELESTYPRPSVYRPAAVLVALTEHNGAPHILLTERTQDMPQHAGQISFPGGGCGEADTDVIATALREAEEEIALPASSVRVLGVLPDYPTRTGFMITPVVGCVDTLPDLFANPAEVASIILCPLSVFSPKACRIDTINIQNYSHQFYAFDTPAGLVWGATAGIIVGLNRLLG